MTKFPDTTILLVSGGSKMVMNHTNSPFSHIVIVCDNQVYDANKPRVKKRDIDDFINSENEYKGTEVWFMLNKNKPTSSQVKKMHEYLEKQINRKYSIGSYLSNKPKKAIHCGELVATALTKIDIDFDSTYRQTPASILLNVENVHYGSKQKT